MKLKMLLSIGKISPLRLLALALPGLFVLAAISSYFWLGRVAEEQLRQLVAGISGRGGIIMEVTEYQRGIFSSRAVTAIQLPQLLPLPHPGAQEHPAPLLFSHQIQHGPLPLGGPTGFSRPSPGLAKISTRLISAAGRQELERSSFKAETTITPGGRAETRLQMAAREEVAPFLGWGELTAHLLYPADLHRLQGELNWTDLGLELAADRQLTITGISATFNYRRQPQGGEQGENLEATMAGSQRWTWQRLQLGDNIFGPLTLEFNWQNIDHRALIALLPASPYLAARLTGAAAAEMAPATAQTLVEAIPRLLKRSPALEIKEATLATPDGPAHGRLKLAYRGRDNSRLFHPAMLFSGLELELSATAPAALAPHLPGSTPAGEEWSLSVDYREGALKINGRPAPIQAILNILR